VTGLWPRVDTVRSPWQPSMKNGGSDALTRAHSSRMTGAAPSARQAPMGCPEAPSRPDHIRELVKSRHLRRLEGRLAIACRARPLQSDRGPAEGYGAGFMLRRRLVPAQLARLGFWRSQARLEPRNAVRQARRRRIPPRKRCPVRRFEEWPWSTNYLFEVILAYARGIVPQIAERIIRSSVDSLFVEQSPRHAVDAQHQRARVLPQEV
jgi:hypothetical protein